MASLKEILKNTVEKAKETQREKPVKESDTYQNVVAVTNIIKRKAGKVGDEAIKQGATILENISKTSLGADVIIKGDKIIKFFRKLTDEVKVGIEEEKRNIDKDKR